MPYISPFAQLYRAGQKIIFRQGNYARFGPRGLLCITIALTTGLAACGESPLSGDVNKILMTVESGDRPGVYELSGTTDLPEDTELLVQAVRVLTPTGQSLPEDSAEEHYAILDRDRILVSEGRWAVELQLWENSNGTSAESWQMQLPQSDRSFTPDNEVQFTVSMPPTGDERALESQWQKSKQTPSDGVVSFTPDGEWFLQAEESIAITPPSVKVPDQPNSFDAGKNLALTESGIPLADDAEGPAASAKDTTDAPLKDSELLR